jgi:hypothetical protein
MLTLRSWTARGDAQQLKAQRMEVEQSLRAGAVAHRVSLDGAQSRGRP